VVFAAPAHLPALLKLAKLCPTLKVIVSVDSWSAIAARGTRPGISSEAALKSWGEQQGVKVMDIVERRLVLSPFLPFSTLSVVRSLADYIYL
jgi:hypothetical protein